MRSIKPLDSPADFGPRTRSLWRMCGPASRYRRNAFINELVMSNKDEKCTSEKPQAENKPVFFQVPDNWDDLREEDRT
jgi:hypothetical protein